jgi:hypothetical protein
MADLPNVFESNAAKLKDLHEAIHTALARRSESPACRAVWEDACRRFHAEYDSLAFPGGLARAFSQLEAGDPTAIEMAVRFLEADPYFFRSGYHKADFIKHLCRKPLSEDQKKRLQQVILARIRDSDKREFRAYCRLASAVTDTAFQNQVAELAGPSRGIVPRHARWVLEYLTSSPAKKKKADDKESHSKT